MTILTNWIFWTIVALIILIMAIIGYLAEKNGMFSKKEETPKETTKSNKEPTVWEKKENPNKDKQEIIHTVPTKDDWSQLPEVTSEETKPQEKPINQPQTVQETPVVSIPEPTNIQAQPQTPQAGEVQSIPEITNNPQNQP